MSIHASTQAVASAATRSLRARVAALHQELHRAEELVAYFEPKAARDGRADPQDVATAHRTIVEAARARAERVRVRITEARNALDALRAPRASTCGARCRDGHACGAPGNGRGGRCKLHGGKSTGAKTDEGRARCRAAAWRRWHPASV